MLRGRMRRVRDGLRRDNLGLRETSGGRRRFVSRVRLGSAQPRYRVTPPLPRC